MENKEETPLNASFIKHLNEKKATVYQMSKDTGIPYTNLEKIKNQKQKINNCSGKDLQKMALFFDCTIEELLEPESYLENTSGTYRKCKYRWVADRNTDLLQIAENGEYVTIDTVPTQSDKKYYCAKKILAEVMIDEYLLCKEREAMLL